MKLLLKAVLAVVVGTVLTLPGQEQCGKVQSPSYPYPWIVHLGFKFGGKVSFGLCDGVLIGDRAVLTTAFCVVTLGGGSIASILPKGGDPAESAVSVAESLPHPAFSPNAQQFNNTDIALLVLSAPVKLGEDLQPLCLPPASPEPADSQLTLIGQKMRVLAHENEPQGEIRSSSVMRIDTEACGKLFDDERIPNTRQACYNASIVANAPGPLIWKREETHHIYALTAFNFYPSRKPDPRAVYELVPLHLDWINGILSKYD